MQNSTKRKMIIYGVFFIAIVGCLFVICLKQCDITKLKEIVINANPFYILLAVLCMVIFLGCEALNLGRVLRELGYKNSVASALKYATAGFFFSGITPSASGGQPMQLYYMSKDGVSISHGSLSLMVDLLSFQIVNFMFTLFALHIQFGYISSLGRVATIFSYTAAVFCGVSSILLSGVLFFPTFSKAVEKFLKCICIKINKKNLIRKIAKQMNEYREGSEYIRNNPGILLRNIATSFVELLALFSISFFAYKAIGGYGANYAQIVALQALIFAGVSFVPLPGGTVAGEGGFKLLFGSVFLGDLLIPGMLLTRGISFYLCIIATGAILLIIELSSLRNRRRGRLMTSLKSYDTIKNIE